MSVDRTTLAGLYRVGERDQVQLVGSFNDRLNLVGGLVLEERVRVARGIRDALAERKIAESWRRDFWAWAAMEVLDKVAKQKGLAWEPKRRELRKGERALLDWLPENLVPDDIRRRGAAHQVAAVRQSLEENLFVKGPFVSVEAIQAAVLDQLGRASKSSKAADLAVLRGRRTIELPRRGGRYSHVTLARIIRYYGLGMASTDGTHRGYRLNVVRASRLTALMSASKALDLREIPWGAFELLNPQSAQAGERNQPK